VSLFLSGLLFLRKSKEFVSYEGFWQWHVTGRITQYVDFFESIVLQKKKVILESAPIPFLSWKDIIPQKDGPNVPFFRFSFGRL